MGEKEKGIKVYVLIVLFCMIPALCYALSPQEEGERVDLTLNDSRPIYSISVEDGAEVALLKQQLKLEPIYTKGLTLYFIETEGIIKRLQELGYAPVRADAYQVFKRVVRVHKKGLEDELMVSEDELKVREDALTKTGVKLINREQNYWVVSGNLSQLSTLERSGYRITKAGTHELRPREVRILVKSREDVAWVGSIHIDIYSVKETESGIFVYGGAFDNQIDQIRNKNFKVDKISTVEEGGIK